MLFDDLDEETVGRLGRKWLERLYLKERETAIRNSKVAQEALDKLGDLQRRYDILSARIGEEQDGVC